MLPILCAKCIEIARNEARGIAEHTWPCAKPRGGWPPTLLQARFEQFLGAGGMIPDGNRRHTTKSGRIIHKVKLLLELHNHIASKLVLRDDRLDPLRRMLGLAPVQNLLKCMMPADDSLDRRTKRR